MKNLLLIGLLAWAVWTSSASSARELAVPEPEADEFHFVVLGDAQFHDPAKFNRLIDQSRQLGPAFVIQVGDLIEGYNNNRNAVAEEWARFSKQVAPLGSVPYIAVPGNHDVYNGDRKVDKHLEALFEQTWGPLYFSFVYKNTLIVGLNTDSTEGANTITGEQWRWLRRTLADSNATHKFVFMHRPPLLMKKADAIHALFRDSGVSHVFYGHHHHYHFFERDGVAYSMTNAAADGIDNQPEVGGFHQLLQVSVSGDDVDVAVIEADAIHAQDIVAPQDNYDTFSLLRGLVPEEVALKRRSTGKFAWSIPLKNNSRRDVTIYTECHSEDHRWRFTPRAIAPLKLEAGDMTTLQLTASFAAARQPESEPKCEFRIPIQTHHGEWFDINRTTIGIKP